MKLRIGLLLLGLLAGVAFAILGKDPGEPVLTAHPGYPVYDANCRKCHGAEGNRKKASRMAGHAIDLGAPAFRDSTDLSEILRIVSEGKGKMKGYTGKLEPTEIAAVAEYVREMPRALAARDSLR